MRIEVAGQLVPSEVLRHVTGRIWDFAYLFEFGTDRLPVTNLLDRAHLGTDDPEMAFSVVAMLPNGEFLATWANEGRIIAAPKLH